MQFLDCLYFAGDRGFDPLGLAKPTEYLQVDIDELDQNAAKNKPGEIIGSFSGRSEKVSATESLQPYDEVRVLPNRCLRIPTLFPPTCLVSSWR
jgi:hypothetical protein